MHRLFDELMKLKKKNEKDEAFKNIYCWSSFHLTL